MILTFTQVFFINKHIIVGGVLVEASNGGTPNYAVSPTLDFRTMAGAGSSCASSGALTNADIGGIAWKEIKIYGKIYIPTPYQEYTLSCSVANGNFLIRLNDEQFDNI